MVFYRSFLPYHRAQRAFVLGASNGLVDSNRYLFDSYFGRRITCNPLALFLGMVSDKRFSDAFFVWVVNKNTTIPERVASDDRVTLVRWGSVSHARELARCGTIIFNVSLPPYFFPQPTQKVIATWHGAPLKALGWDSLEELTVSANPQRSLNLSSMALLPNEYSIQKVIIDGFRAGLVSHKSLGVGSPRLDGAIKATPVSGPKKPPIVLVALTWRQLEANWGNNEEDYLNLAEYLKKEIGSRAIVIFQLHQITARRFPRLQEKLPTLPPSRDFYDTISDVALLISDYSSLIVDFLALNKPVICFIPDIESYNEERGLLVDLGDLPVEIVTDLNSLASQANVTLAQSRTPSGSRLSKRLTELEDGKATQRVLDLLHAPGRPVIAGRSRKKRVLLYVGPFMMNGITSSAIAFLEALDYEKFEVYLVQDAAELRKYPARVERAKSIPHQVNIVLRPGGMTILPSEAFAYHRYLQGRAKASDFRVVTEIFSREAQRIFGQNHFDIAIQFNGYGPYWTGLISSVTAAKKIIFQHNDKVSEWKNSRKNHHALASVFSMYQFFDKVVSVSEALLSINQESITKAGYQVSNWDYCRNFIPAARTKAPTGDELDSLLPDVVKSIIANPQTRRFVHIARFSPEKNHETLVRAFKQVVSASSEEVHLFLVGNGPLEVEVKKLVSELGLQDRIHFLGVLENPIGVLSVSECLLLPSQYEGQPIVILEALALGKTIVATRFASLKAFMEPVGDRVIDIDFTQDDLVRGVLDALGRESASQAWEGLFDYKGQVRKDIFRLLETDSG